MTPEFVTGFFWEAIKITISLAAPMLLVGLVAGVLVSMFQAATQINEMTLVFVPKMLGVAVALIVFFPLDVEYYYPFYPEPDYQHSQCHPLNLRVLGPINAGHHVAFQFTTYRDTDLLSDISTGGRNPDGHTAIR